MDIAIIGAGLGGLAAAAALLQRGHRVRVYEQSPQLGEVGAGIQMSANAMKVLDRLGLRPALEPVAVRPLAFEFRRFDSGEMLHRLPLGAAHEAKHGAPYFQLHRADLHRALQDAVLALDAQALVLGARATRAEEHSGHVQVGFEDGSVVDVELLVGADGIKSVVRRSVLATVPTSTVTYHDLTLQYMPAMAVRERHEVCVCVRERDMHRDASKTRRGPRAERQRQAQGSTQ